MIFALSGRAGRCCQAAATAGSLTRGSSLNGVMVFQRHVAGPLDGPRVVLLEEDGSGQAGDGSLVGEDADSVRRLISPLSRSGGLALWIVDWGRGNRTCRHLITVPGYGPILSSAMAAMVVNPAVFRSGRDFSASLGLVPRQDGTGGRVKLGPISKRGNGYLRRLLVNGAMSVLNSKRARQDPWLVKLLETKERKVAAVALANKMARIGWVLMMRQEDFRTMPAAA